MHLALCVVINPHAELVMHVTLADRQWRHISVLRSQLGDHSVYYFWAHLQYLDIIHIPTDCALIDIVRLVHESAVIQVRIKPL